MGTEGNITRHLVPFYEGAYSDFSRQEYERPFRHKALFVCTG